MKKNFLVTFMALAMSFSLCACLDDEEYESSGENYNSDYSDYSDDTDDEEYDDNSESDDSDYSDYVSDEDYESSDSSNNSSDSESDGEAGDYVFPYDASLGTAKELDGNIAVVSLFANDHDTSWNSDSSEDQEMEETIYKNLSIATDYLENKCKEYGRDVNFIFDWNEYPELAYNVSVDANYEDIDNNGEYVDYAMWESIQNEVPTKTVLEKTNATQIIYMAYFNTPDTCSITSCTRNYYEGMPYPFEICYMFMKSDGEVEPPACFAHEMLHTFGAVDLYSASEYGVTQEYVDYVESTGLNDIMRVCEDPQTGYYNYEAINNEITDITAYYVGLTDSSETVDEWGFEQSQH